ncbi:MAG: segregation/condensation protein A [Alphaproteobacteria bacterium]|nr:segregation/condensation protein A [Alphaproteobacteria bacterium]
MSNEPHPPEAETAGPAAPGAADFEEDGADRLRRPEDALVLALDGFEGPIDLLLTLARDQKVDLAGISILQLADQYLGYIERARELKLEIAADYLVMAAWLAYLKSRILLPKPETTEEAEDPAEMAARLAFQLQRLEAMQNVSKLLMQRTQLGQDFFARGMPEALKVERRARFEAALYDLLKAYGAIRSRQYHGGQLRILPTRLYSMEQALERLRHIIGQRTDWQTLEAFLPADAKGEDRLLSRSMLAGTFAAMLELTREGLAEVHQAGAFEPIYVRGVQRVDNPTLKGEEADEPPPRSEADALDGLDEEAIGALLDAEEWDAEEWGEDWDDAPAEGDGPSDDDGAR